MKNKKFSLNNLLQNNKIVFIIALIISVSVWVYMSMGSSNDTSVTISNIPVQIELPEDAAKNGLQIFSGGDQTASVTITGNRAILGSVTSSDITVTAVASAIDRSGEYQLSVTASKTNLTSNFEITSTVTPSFINVYVDYLRETTFPIQENVVYKVADGYYASTTLSSETIAISGPQTEISKIAKVSATAELTGTVKDTTTAACSIVVYDNDGNEMTTDMLTLDSSSLEATISVLPEKEVSVVPEFVNKPSGINITDDMISIEPDSILLAAPADVLDATTSVKLESIDFTTLKNDKITFNDIGIDIPTDCKNISNTATAKFTLDLSSFKSKTFTVDNFKVDGLSSEYTAKITQKSLSVTVIGSESEIESLSESSITAVIDTSDFKGTLGSVQMPVIVQISGTKTCWAYGSYKANLTISNAE
jgi:azurin